MTPLVLLLALANAIGPLVESSRLEGQLLEGQLLEGRICDASGQGIPGAEVRLQGAIGAAVRTDSTGAFILDPGAERTGRLVAQARGFAAAEAAWSLDPRTPLVIVLNKSLAEEVTVTAGRSATRILDTPARAVVLEREWLEATPALTVDDALRQVPGFTLFRRSGSRVANPTAQGSSLRGLGPSGASRTLILLDGVPLNDAFGGWVYWSRIPRASLSRVEIVEGGGSDLYGSAALGGVVQAFGRSDGRALTVEATGGNEGTGGLSVFASRRVRDWGLRLAGEAFTTDGYVLTSPEEKGPVDTAAGARHLNGVATVVRHFGPLSSAFIRVSAFGESRANGTPLQTNDTDLQELQAGTDAPLWGGSLVVRGWLGTQTYGQSFSAVAADRARETLTRGQEVPTSWTGGSAAWSRTLATGHGLVGGFEARHVDGRSDETVYASGRATSQVSAGGEQGTWAVFGGTRLALGPRFLASLGVRYDHWTERNGFSRTQALVGDLSSAETLYDDRRAGSLSPRASLLFRAGARVQLFASGYGAFRGPTLNELYRSFRVGNTLTLANPELTKERLGGGEMGATWTSKGERGRVRVVGFVSRLLDPVANITLRSTPALITRQRQNLGRTRSSGLEADATVRLSARVSASAGYAFTIATVGSFDADPGLVGNDVPLVSRHQGTLQLRYTNPRVLDVSAQARAGSSQWDDDQNQLRLRGLFTLDAQVSRRFSRVEAFVASENLTGRRYEVGRTPVLTLGPPRLVRIGVRFGR